MRGWRVGSSVPEQADCTVIRLENVRTVGADEDVGRGTPAEIDSTRHRTADPLSFGRALDDSVGVAQQRGVATNEVTRQRQIRATCVGVAGVILRRTHQDIEHAITIDVPRDGGRETCLGLCGRPDEMGVSIYDRNGSSPQPLKRHSGMTVA